MAGFLQLKIGLRYTRSNRRGFFLSLISMVSILGIALGVMVLITCLSVMNGFEKEIKSGILRVISHARINFWGYKNEQWRELKSMLEADEQVKAVSPYIESELMLACKGLSTGALIQGVDPAQESKVSPILDSIYAGGGSKLKPRSYKVFLGKALAEKMKLKIGDKVTLVSPAIRITAAGLLPRMKRFTVAGFFELGRYDFDKKLIVTHIADASRLLSFGDFVSGLRIKTANPEDLSGIESRFIENGGAYYNFEKWTDSCSNLLDAIKLQKKMMFIILSMVVAIAAFNLVSTIFLMVNDKKGDIAILRTMGISPGSIVGIFISYGILIGTTGIVIGCAAGWLLSLNISSIAEAIEGFFNIQFMPKEVYFISKTLPTEVLFKDVAMVAIVAFILSAVSTVYPSWKASRLPPADSLRYE